MAEKYPHIDISKHIWYELNTTANEYGPGWHDLIIELMMKIHATDQTEWHIKDPQAGSHRKNFFYSSAYLLGQKNFFPARYAALDSSSTGSVAAEENGRLRGMLRRLLGKVNEGRFSRALAGLAAGWQFEVGHRIFGKSGVEVGGHVRYSGKKYTVYIQSSRRYTCSCQDYMSRKVLCKHIAFVAMAELAHYALERSAHRQVQEVRGH